MERDYSSLLGRKYNMLTVVSTAPSYKNGGRRWECLCDCGNKIIVAGYNLKNNHTQSCGCLQKKRAAEASYKHGKCLTRTYHSWNGMKHRCDDANHPAYKHYGGRGIGYDPAWKIFTNFYADMGDCPPKHTIERINNNLGYSKNNCRWATRTEQARNTRVNKLITFQNKTQALAVWGEEIGINPSIIRRRLIRGWSTEEALSPIIMKNQFS